MTGSISQTISYFFEHYASEEANKLFLHDFALDDLIHIKAKDTDKIEKHEFLAFMLTMMKKVDQVSEQEKWELKAFLFMKTNT